VTLQTSGARDWDEVRRLAPWFHNLHLPDGRRTAPDHPLGDFPAFKWRQIATALPEDLTDCRVLDIGCNAGFYTFELAKRGAAVLGIDHDEHYLRQARWAAERMGLEEHVEFRRMGVYQLGDLDETFDLVLFLGVLYHLRYPLFGLDLVAERVRGTLVLQTLTMPLGDALGNTPPDVPIDGRDALRDVDWPAMAFVEHHLAGDHTNWWVPSEGAVAAMVRTTGLRVVARPGHEIWLCERERASHHLDELHQASRGTVARSIPSQEEQD
jgi:tRNA (mo5U34)-methyltransferase